MIRLPNKHEKFCMISSTRLNSMKKGRDYHLDCGTRVLHLSERPHVMGILNVTPDSFFDGGMYFTAEQAIERAGAMVEGGADIIDIGGESTRPGSDPVSETEELERIIPVIENLSQSFSVPISIDTKKAGVAEAAIRAGACIVNDVSAMQSDPRMKDVVKQYSTPVVLMHMRGIPKNMQSRTDYVDLIDEVVNFLQQSAEQAVEAGISADKIIIDPGIEFGKKWEDNFLLLSRLDRFLRLGYPLLVGPSRKSFIGWALDLSENERLMGTASAVAASVLNGAHIVRVHDVQEMAQVVRIADRIARAGSKPVNAG